MYDLVIKGGTVILEDGETVTDVAVTDGKIAAIGADLEGTETIDATGLVVSPGMIDGHAHITDPGGGYRVRPPREATSTRSLPAPAASLMARRSPLVVAGTWLRGISTIEVMPPLAQAAVPVR